MNNTEHVPKKRKTKPEKKAIVKKILNGLKISDAVKESRVNKGTIYRWKNDYAPHEIKIGQFTVSDIKGMQKQLEKAEIAVKYLQGSPFIANADKKIVMDYLEKIVRENDADRRPSIRELCRIFCIDYSVFDKHLNRAKGKHSWYYERRDRLSNDIIRIYGESAGRAGPTTVWQILKKQKNEPISLGFVKDVMRQLDLKGVEQKSTKRNPFMTKTQLRREMENLLKDDFSAEAPNLKWVSDCKRIYANGKAYVLCVILDLFSRRIIGYHIGKHESTRLIIATLKQAISSRAYIPGELILHTDRGPGYTSSSTRRLLSKSKIKCSFSETHEPPENGVAEAFFSRFAHEELSVAYNNMHYRSEQEMRERIANYIHKFNHERPHQYNGGLTPVQKETNYRRAHMSRRIFKGGATPVD